MFLSARSPFLNVLSEGNVAKTLKLMDAAARYQAHARRGAGAMPAGGQRGFHIAGSIARNLGSEYVQGLKSGELARSGDVLAQEQATVQQARGKSWIRWARKAPHRSCAANLGRVLGLGAEARYFAGAGHHVFVYEALQAYTLLWRKGSIAEKSAAAALPYSSAGHRTRPGFLRWGTWKQATITTA